MPFSAAVHSMLVGSTFAWFTDTASTGVNNIQAGTLDVVLEVSYDNGKTWQDANGQTLDFIKAEDGKDEEILWEPGCTYELPLLRVRNEGNLWLKYQLAITGIKGDAKLNEAIEWSNGTDELNLTALNTWTNLAPKGTTEGDTTDTSASIKIVGHMKEEAGNEYQGLSIEGIGITVFATQLNKEHDSFGPDYDKDAPTLISINGKSYKTLNEAIDAAAEGDVITVGGYVTYDMGNTTGGKDWSKVSIVAETNSGVVPTIAFTGYGSANPLKNATISNVKIVDNTVGDVEGAWEHGYFEVEGGTYTNVEFVNGVQANGTVTFNGCTFNGKYESNLKMYGAWVNSGTSIFTNCAFVGTRGLKAHEAYGSEITAVTVEGCAFNGMTEKPGIALGDLNADTTVTLKNNTFTDTQPGDGAYIKNHGVPYQYETDTDVTTFTFVAEGNTTTLNVYTVADLWEITNISNTYTSEGVYDTNAAIYGFAGVTVNLMNDIDFEGASWRAIGRYSNGAAFCGTFNGNGHTISNFKYDPDDRSVNPKSTGYNSGFFGSVGPGAVIKDLTIDGADVRGGNSNSGALVGFVYAMDGSVAFENITVKNAFIHQGRQSGGVAGIVEYGTVTFTNCKVVDSALLSFHNNVQGAIYAANHSDHPANITVTDCSYENVIMMQSTGWTEFYDWTLDQIVEKYGENAASGNVQ